MNGNTIYVSGGCPAPIYIYLITSDVPLLTERIECDPISIIERGQSDNSLHTNR